MERMTSEDVVERVCGRIDEAFQVDGMDPLTPLSNAVVAAWCGGKTKKGEDRMRLLAASADGIDTLPDERLSAFVGGGMRWGAPQADAVEQGIIFLTGPTIFC